MKRLFVTPWRKGLNPFLVRGLWGTAVGGFILFLCADAGIIVSEQLSVLAAQSSQPRHIVVIGDLHMGLGREPSGAWRPSEDFRWAEEFQRFLEVLSDRATAGTDLILNGDTFELSTPTVMPCNYADATVGCAEADALQRLNRVLAAHSREVDALAAFSRSELNRVVLVPGDVDAALLFSAVRERVEQAFDVREGRVTVAASGGWTSDDGQVYVEHGHQIGWRADRFQDWPEPFVEYDGRRHLGRPWGEGAITGLLAEREQRLPIIDNFSDLGAGLSHGLHEDGSTDLGELATSVVRYALFRMPWQQFRVDLDAGEVQAPSWDLDAVRELGQAFLVDAFPDDDLLKPLVDRAAGTGQLTELMESLDDAEITAICDYRAAVRRARRRFERPLTQIDPQGPPVSECPRMVESRGGQFDYFWRTRDRIYGDRIATVQASLPTGNKPIAIFVHGHTHLVDWRQRVLEMTRLGRDVIVDGFSPVRNALSPVVVNGGAWQRTITPVQFDRLADGQGLSGGELLRTLQPEHLAPCYSFVQIEPYEDIPQAPTVRYWRRDEQEEWGLGSSCGRQPVAP